MGNLPLYSQPGARILKGIPSMAANIPQSLGAEGYGEIEWVTDALVIVTVIFLVIIGVQVVVQAACYVEHRRFVSLIARRIAKASADQNYTSVADPAASAESAPPSPPASPPEDGCRSSDLQELPDEDRMGISFSDLSYWAPNGHQILHRVTGAINPGDNVAVMGPSGSGKTTCLDVLAGRRRTGTQTGNVYINGHDRRKPEAAAYFDSHCGYMLQLAEAFCPALTVRENLAYAALLRLPTKMSFDQKMERIDAVVDVS